MPSGWRMSLARQSCTALAPSVIEPPPTVTIRSASAARAWSAAAMTASRGVCGGIASKVPTQRGPSTRRMFSISSVSRFSVPLTIRNARFAPSRSSCSTIASDAGRPNTTSSIAPNTTRPLCTVCPPRTFGLCCGPWGLRLAEEICDVMREDDAVGPPARTSGLRTAASPRHRSQRVARSAPRLAAMTWIAISRPRATTPSATSRFRHQPAVS